LKQLERLQEQQTQQLLEQAEQQLQSITLSKQPSQLTQFSNKVTAADSDISDDESLATRKSPRSVQFRVNSSALPTAQPAFTRWNSTPNSLGKLGLSRQASLRPAVSPQSVNKITNTFQRKLNAELSDKNKSSNQANGGNNRKPELNKLASTWSRQRLASADANNPEQVYISPSLQKAVSLAAPADETLPNSTPAYVAALSSNNPARRWARNKSYTANNQLSPNHQANQSKAGSDTEEDNQTQFTAASLESESTNSTQEIPTINIRPPSLRANPSLSKLASLSNKAAHDKNHLSAAGTGGLYASSYANIPGSEDEADTEGEDSDNEAEPDLSKSPVGFTAVESFENNFSAKEDKVPLPTPAKMQPKSLMFDKFISPATTITASAPPTAATTFNFTNSAVAEPIKPAANNPVRGISPIKFEFKPPADTAANNKKPEPAPVKSQALQAEKIISPGAVKSFTTSPPPPPAAAAAANQISETKATSPPATDASKSIFSAPSNSFAFEWGKSAVETNHKSKAAEPPTSQQPFSFKFGDTVSNSSVPPLPFTSDTAAPSTFQFSFSPSPNKGATATTSAASSAPADITNITVKTPLTAAPGTNKNIENKATSTTTEQAFLPPEVAPRTSPQPDVKSPPPATAGIIEKSNPAAVEKPAVPPAAVLIEKTPPTAANKSSGGSVAPSTPPQVDASDFALPAAANLSSKASNKGFDFGLNIAPSSSIFSSKGAEEEKKAAAVGANVPAFILPEAGEMQSSKSLSQHAETDNTVAGRSSSGDADSNAGTPPNESGGGELNLGGLNFGSEGSNNLNRAGKFDFLDTLSSAAARTDDKDKGQQRQPETSSGNIFANAVSDSGRFSPLKFNFSSANSSGNNDLSFGTQSSGNASGAAGGLFAVSSTPSSLIPNAANNPFNTQASAGFGLATSNNNNMFSSAATNTNQQQQSNTFNSTWNNGGPNPFDTSTPSTTKPSNSSSSDAFGGFASSSFGSLAFGSAPTASFGSGGFGMNTNNNNNNSNIAGGGFAATAW
jgi:hypothetical protein